jgi:CRISPR-associated protein Cmr2
MTTYLAITIGPIFKTITQQRRTRSVFAASYFFSYTMKKLVDILSNDKGLKDQILLPSPRFLDQADYLHPGCGLYPDRLIMESKGEGDTQKLLEARDETFRHLAGKLQAVSQVDLNYLKSYLYLYAIELEAAPGKETINQINRQLDKLELFPNFPVGADGDHLQHFFEEIKGYFILEDAFGPQKKERFDSLTEIATRDLSLIPGRETDYRSVVKNTIEQNIKLYQQAKKDERVSPDLLKAIAKEDDSFYNMLRSYFSDELRPYHRYVAIVYADGDSIGKYIEGLGGDRQQIKAFSEKLFEFGLEARKTIEKYGGTPVFIGGDDLLFFAPVASRLSGKTQTIFDLIFQLDNDFYGFFKPGPGSPSLSYGVSITYHKYPLNEALIKAYELLSQAKDAYSPPAKRKHPNKNSIAFKQLTHSGKYFEGVIEKDKPEWDQASQQAIYPKDSLFGQFRKLLTEIDKGDEQDTHDTFLNSLTHGMAFFQELFEDLLLGETPDPAAVQNLFDNSFNEGIHDLNREFINRVKQFVVTAYANRAQAKQQMPEAYEGTEAMSKEALDLIYATLRFIHFIKTTSPQMENQYV